MGVNVGERTRWMPGRQSISAPQHETDDGRTMVDHCTERTAGPEHTMRLPEGLRRAGRVVKYPPGIDDVE